MSDTDRRGFLRGGLKAALLGTGGVLLPMEGRSLFSFPDAAAMPDIPVIAKGFTPSAECLKLREIKREMFRHRIDPSIQSLSYEEQCRQHRALWSHYNTAASTLHRRPATTWAHVSDLAESAWFHAQKEEVEVGDPDWRYHEYTGQLARQTRNDSVWRSWSSSSDATASYAALIEAVLTMTGGERYDPRVIERAA
jgi:hypothetical protein